MSSPFVKIPLSRLQSGRPFARELFLNMPRNGKMLRLVAKDGELTAAAIARLEGGNRELLALAEPGDATTPEAFPLYLDEATATPTPGAAAAAAIAVTGEDAPQTVVMAPPSEAAEAVTRIAAPGAEPEAQFSLTPSGEDAAAATILESDSPDGESAALISASPGAEEQPASSFSASVETTALAHIAAAQADVPVSETFAADGAEPASFELSVDAGDSARNTDKEDTFTLEDPPADEALPTAGELQSDLSTFIARFKAEAIATGDQELVRLSRNLEAAGEAFSRFAAEEPESTETLPTLVGSLQASMAAVTAATEEVGEAFGSAQGLLASLELASNIVEKKLQDSAAPISGPAPETALPAEVSTSSAAPASSTGGLSATSRAAINYREMPLIASRLAAQLAHSLGYGNLNFLSDLALATMVVFSAKAGASIDETPLPPLGRAALGRSDRFAEAAFEDSLWIIEFLEAYFQNPECDRTKKEFSARAFESTLAAYELGDHSADAFVTARWRQFVNRGPTMAAVSLCSKAYSRASKSAKSMISEIPLG